MSEQRIIIKLNIRSTLAFFLLPHPAATTRLAGFQPDRDRRGERWYGRIQNPSMPAGHGGWASIFNSTQVNLNVKASRHASSSTFHGRFGLSIRSCFACCFVFCYCCPQHVNPITLKRSTSSLSSPHPCNCSPHRAIWRLPSLP